MVILIPQSLKIVRLYLGDQYKREFVICLILQELDQTTQSGVAMLINGVLGIHVLISTAKQLVKMNQKGGIHGLIGVISCTFTLNLTSVNLKLKILSDVRPVIGLIFVMAHVKLSIVQTVWIRENVI